MYTLVPVFELGRQSRTDVSASMMILTLPVRSLDYWTRVVGLTTSWIDPKQTFEPVCRDVHGTCCLDSRDSQAIYRPRGTFDFVDRFRGIRCWPWAVSDRKTGCMDLGSA